MPHCSNQTKKQQQKHDKKNKIITLLSPLGVQVKPLRRSVHRLSLRLSKIRHRPVLEHWLFSVAGRLELQITISQSKIQERETNTNNHYTPILLSILMKQ